MILISSYGGFSSFVSQSLQTRFFELRFFWEEYTFYKLTEPFLQLKIVKRRLVCKENLYILIDFLSFMSAHSQIRAKKPEEL